MFAQATQLLDQDSLAPADARRLLGSVGFADWQTAQRRIERLGADPHSRDAFAECLPILLAALAEAPTPDAALVNFERFAQSVADRPRLFRSLAENARAVEILVRLFVGSQYLTEILLRNPHYLQRLTEYKRLADCKSRADFISEAREAIAVAESLPEKLDALRRHQKWELLRIGACDAFGLMDLRTVTVQLSLLADSLVQVCLTTVAETLRIEANGFAVLAFGKLGGEELNYSSDIDLVFLAEGDATRFWPLSQGLVKALQDATGEGFLYRVDLRLRPWGRSGPLVTSVEAYLDYLKKHASAWERQALLKARTIAGDLAVGERFLHRAQPRIFVAEREAVRVSVRESKQRIEAELNRRGKAWGEVKSGEGSIRDIEFITQFLQLAHGAEQPQLRSINTLDGLVRLADFGVLQADEYRQLTGGYVFLRTIEHALQLMHNKQAHSLPRDPQELSYLARRLDFATAEQFVAHYERHCKAVRAIYQKHLEDAPPSAATNTTKAERWTLDEPEYAKAFSAEELELHRTLLRKLAADNPAEVAASPNGDGAWQVTVAGYDYPGDLSVICGLLFVYGFDIIGGQVFTDRHLTPVAPPIHSRRDPHDSGKKAFPNSPRPRLRGRGVGGEGAGVADPPPLTLPSPPEGEESSEMTAKRDVAKMFVNVFTVRPPLDLVLPEVWVRYQADLVELFELGRAGRQREAQGRLAKRVAGALRDVAEPESQLYPVEIELDNATCDHATVLHIRSEDTIGFLYELSNALSLSGIDIERVVIRSDRHRVFDTLYVTDAASGRKITNPARQQELRAAVVLIKHFTHLLPRSPNPEAALLHFREFLEQLFRQPDWYTEISSLERPDVLEALARLLGVSDFLWEDFLRLQYSNLFPVVKDLAALTGAKPKEQLRAELDAELQRAADPEDRRRRLNAFKDREMFRIDMRHILGQIGEFGQFSAELSDVAEVIVSAAHSLCDAELRELHGAPQCREDGPCRLTVCALGKCGGRELGFASDIELMFVYEAEGQTSGPNIVSNAEYFTKLVESFTQAIQAKREGIFRIDLRLRPYGNAGSLAVSLAAFERYFGPNGPAWPYERQALVRLRPLAGDMELGERIVELRDQFLYTGAPFDVASMRAMRERQIRQLVKAGTFNAKLSPGGSVDCEYLVQGLQLTHGHRDPSLRTTNTCAALAALERAGILAAEHHTMLREAYIFERRLIDALRMVRGDARDLTVPPAHSEEFEFLARRLGYGGDVWRLQADLERHSRHVQELGRLLEKGD